MFWQLDVDSEIQPNGMNLLEDNLIRNSTKWLNLNEKNLIVISRDYGQTASKVIVKLGNTIFVANGIGDKNDTIIQIYMNDEGFYILKKSFNQNIYLEHLIYILPCNCRTILIKPFSLSLKHIFILFCRFIFYHKFIY